MKILSRSFFILALLYKNAMECKNCELRQRQYYCTNCLKNHLRDFRLQTHHFSSDRDEHVARAFRAFKSIESGRLQIRAEIAQANRSLDQLAVDGLAKVRRDCESKRDRLRTLRATLAKRRRTLNAARLLPPQSYTLTKESQEHSLLSQTIARARSGLVQELVEVFHVVEVGGRPAVGGRSGAKGEWTIGGLVLPVPGDVRRYPPDHINAVITHTIHFLGLLTFYLGIKLPFEVSWSCRRFGVGMPWIGAGRGSESWAKWTSKHPLHLTSKPSSTPSSPSSSPSSTPASLADSEVPEQTPAHGQNQSFTTGLAMLLYNVCYLAHTQGVEIPLSQAGDALSNLWAVCCSGELGRRSHSTTPILLPPIPPSFTLDFAQVLQATAASPARAARIRPGRSAQEAGIGRMRSERIVEEDGWDVVDLGGEEGFG
ncbi:UV radiation resistance protein and autophagy-related subunit 14-domain-containing protein [Suillus clintonianus]|uniref:UV radiation resistance protein and autophagy-related subunit 14-domain-containing protein n=1 Tax=Suillus clintonianus TaxID=1904413 RepID=UPI001B86D8F5|nr:UV radiation resistance protein and autophagy-related subunit 14-domain-containing protein [Suillus clintonianus]KAG2148783.1 UV radiation resistance protein and autophagy-related subunit 14-domain-containing protein [Suillus clintonianus]